MIAIKKILCAVDFSEASAQVAEYAKTLAKCLGSEIVCLYVAPSLVQYTNFDVASTSIDKVVCEIVNGAQRTMDEFIARHFPGAAATGRVVTGYAAEEILAEAEKTQAGMVVMGTHGRIGLKRILFGSVAEKVVKTASCPVLTIRPAAGSDD
jgi:nucleotide-binding universal stress UspA family protein